MGSVIIRFQGRKLWDRSNSHAWFYHLFYLIESEALEKEIDIPAWISDWIVDTKPYLDSYTIKLNLKLLSVLEKENGDVISERVALVIDYTQKLLKRLENFDEFLASEQKKWLKNPNNADLELIDHVPDYHMEQLESFADLQEFRTFGRKFLKLLIDKG